jgi:threonine dehydrogenase-like Zn-dependent dehydrogenase
VDATALWLVGRRSVELRTEQLREPSSRSVVVQTTASGISRGTERLVFEGRVPESVYASMRCPYQTGLFPWPIKYGYSAVGVVAEGGSRGRRVYALHPHQDWFVLPEAALLPIPDAVDDVTATLAANMETALNAMWDAELARGERVAVIGAGTLGLLLACLVAHGHDRLPQIADPNPARRALAVDLGFDVTPPELDSCDVVFHASGNPDGLVDALALAAFEARIIEMSWYGARGVTLPLGERFHTHRLRIVSSQVGHVARAKRTTIDRRTRLAMALDHLADPRYEKLIGARVAFRDLPTAYERILTTDTTPPHAVVVY